MSAVSWPSLLQQLVTSSKQKKCSVRSLDTIIFRQNDNEELKWYFTTKNGSIALKKTADLSPVDLMTSIKERFTRFALSNPQNTSKTVAVLFSNGVLNSMNIETLSKFLETEFYNQDKNFLQVFLHPFKGENSYYRCNVLRSLEDNYSFELNKVLRNTGSETLISLNETILFPQIKQFSEEIIRFLKENSNAILLKASINFIVDDNNHAWLSEISNAIVQVDDNTSDPGVQNEIANLSPTINDDTKNNIYLQDSNQNKDNEIKSVPFNERKENNDKHDFVITNNKQENKIKKKKDVLGPKSSYNSSEKTVKKSPLDTPPSMELIAKFAAEKERQSKILSEEASESNYSVDGSAPSKFSNINVTKKKKKTGNSNQQTTSNVNSLPLVKNAIIYNDGEKRLIELEKMANSNASYLQRQHQQKDVSQNDIDSSILLNRSGLVRSAGGSISSVILSPRSAGRVQSDGMSGIEAEFLVRQIHSADSSQISALTAFDNYDNALVPLTSKQGFGYTNQILPTINTNNVIKNATINIKDKMSEALQEKILILEKQIVSLNTSLERKEAELDKKDKKIKKMTSETDNMRSEFSRNLKLLESEHETEIFKIREQHSREKAALSLAVHKVEVMEDSSTEWNNNNNNKSPSKKELSINGSGSGNKYEANAKLLEQMEILRKEQRKQFENFADERRQMQTDFNNKLSFTERKLKAEIIELKSIQVDLEDKLSQSSDELTSAMASIQNLQNVNSQLEISKNKAIETQTKLRSDLKNVQQSVQASYRLESSQGISMGVDPGTTLKLNDAKNEAKTRQLVNKVEFLKSQLEAEKKSCDEAKAASELSRQKLEEIRDEFKFRMHEAEQSKSNLVSETEQRLESYYEDRMRELSTLQARVRAVQGQLEDASVESSIAKQREESSKAALNKSMAHQAALRIEIDQLKSQIQSMNEERDKELSKNAGKPSNDAVIRRLDNERQYLKSQLASEITHKNELQAALIKSQQQLNEVQNQWNSDVDSLKESISVEQQKVLEADHKLKESELVLKSELSRLQAQNKELKDGFVKIRDQVRMEQLAVENSVTDNRRLTETLESTRREVARLEQLDIDNTIMYKQQLDAINSTFREQEAIKDLEMQRMRDELNKQFIANSDAQNYILDLKDRFNNEKFKLCRLTKTSALLNIFQKWRQTRLQNFFRVWSTNNTLMAVASQFRSHIEGILKQTTDAMNEEKQRSLTSLEDMLRKEFNEYESRLRNEFSDTLDNALANAEMDKQTSLQNSRMDFEAKLQQAESDFQFDLEKAKKDGEDAVDQMFSKKETEIKKLKDKHMKQMKIAEEDANTHLENMLKNKENELEESFSIRLKQHEDDLTDIHNKKVLQMVVDFDFKTHEMSTNFKNQISVLKEKHRVDTDIALDNAEKYRQQSLQELNDLKEKEKGELEEQIRSGEADKFKKYKMYQEESTEKRIRELRSIWQQEFDDTLEIKRKEFEDLLSQKMEEYAKKMEMDKQRAVKLEASKWKQAMKDSDQNHDLDVIKAKAELASEKEKELRIDLERMQNRFDLQKEKDNNLHKIEINNINESHRAAMQQNNELHRVALEQQKLDLETSIKEKLDAIWSEKLSSELSSADASAQKKLQKEKERMDQLKQDFSIQSQNFAAERSLLQRQVNSSDERIRKMEEMNKAEIDQLRKDFEDSQFILEEKWNDQKQIEFKKLEDDHKIHIEALQERNKLESDQRVQAEKNSLRRELEIQIEHMQEDSEKLITGLESAMAALAKEKKGLTGELESLTTKLEETEDSLYDVQQTLKNRTKEQSVVVWKSMVKIFQMKERFRKGIMEFDKEAEKKYESIRKEMQLYLNESNLTVLKLSAIIQEVESNRKKIQGTLTSYKADELESKRRKIQLIEKDLERLTLEKEALEEQRDSMDAEVDHYEQQVRDIEDQIREHNRESSMSNGRVNVAHARKKRRLDSELERILEAIDQKRVTMTQLDDKAAEKSRLRDEKELEMIDLEKQLVQILLEQQRVLLHNVDEGKLFEERCRLLINVARLPWPTPANPTMEDILLINKKKLEE